MADSAKVSAASRVRAKVILALKNYRTPTGGNRTGVFADALAIVDARQSEVHSAALGDDAAPLAGSKGLGELVNDGHKDGMHCRNQGDVSRQKQVGKVREVLRVIELKLDVERTVRWMPNEALWNDAWQLAIEGRDNRLAFAVDTNAVEPKVKITAAGSIRATVAAKAISEMLTVEEIGLIAVPDVEEKERAITAVRHEAAMGTQALANRRRQRGFDAAK